MTLIAGFISKLISELDQPKNPVPVPVPVPESALAISELPQIFVNPKVNPNI